MLPEKRIRLFSGLLCEPGLAVARPLRGASPSAVLLAGGDEAIALSPTLRRFARDVDCQLVEETVLGSTADQWTKNGWLDEAIRRHRPSVTIAVLPPTARSAGASVTIWLPPPGFYAEPEDGVLPAESVPGWSPTARGYAAWATAAWAMATST